MRRWLAVLLGGLLMVPAPALSQVTPDLRGTVVPPDEDDASGFVVRVRDTPSLRVRVEADGSFRFTRLPPGHHVLVATRERDGAWGSLVVRVPDDQDVNIPVWHEEGVLRGTVLHRSGPVDGAQVDLWKGPVAWEDHRHLGSTTTDAGGEFVFRGIPTGDHHLHASTDRGLWAEDVSVEVNRETGRGTVVVEMV